MRSTAAQKAVVVAACTAALVGLGASTAAAGEITGKGRSLATVPNPDYVPGDPESSPYVLKAGSVCAYSGLNDEWVAAQLTPTTADDDLYPRTQAPPDVPIPGIAGYACNPVGARK